tara:strand:+ start:40517 stop:40840 length:324 start_codon:yes stop_codon:yes gene_type:complete
MESNKEFITRMTLMINELPQEKRRDYFTLLAFLDFQLTMRDNLFITELFDKLDLHLLNKIDWYGRAKLKQEIRQALRDFCKASQYSFTFHDNHEKQMQQVVGSREDK